MREDIVYNPILSVNKFSILEDSTLKKTAVWTFCLLLAAALIAGSFGGCGCSDSTDYITPAPPRGVTGEIDTGKEIKAVAKSVGTEGGFITLDDEESPLNGMVLTIPPNTYGDKKKFEISYAPIESHTFGSLFNPVTPLISIDNGGEFADQLMEVTIPIDLPEDHFAMGFIYDSESQKLEGMPLVSLHSNSITVATRHFTDMLISIIPNAKLKKDIDTGFRPGIDDWQFVNYGSFVAPGGHCAGQSVTALWYYVTQPDGAGYTLNGRYDNNGEKPATPKLQYDDSYGYRLASVVQKDIDWESFANDLWYNLAGVDDQLTYNLFAYSMQLTGEPQEVGIFSSQGGGHDMICYRIFEGNLYIADPNYPCNIDRRIEFVDDKFKPYNSGANAEEIAAGEGKEYETIQYCAKTTTVDWSLIESRWKEFREGTIGNNKFPSSYTLLYVDGKGKERALPIDEELVWDSNSIDLKIKGEDFNITHAFACYRGEERVTEQTDGFELIAGENELGIFVLGKVNNKWKYIDFHDVTIICGDLVISPNKQNGEIGEELNFEAIAENPPKNARYDWYVDGHLLQRDYGPDFTASFDEAGEYQITVKLMDQNEKNVQEAQATAVIEAKTTTTQEVNNLDYLHNMKYYKHNMSGNFIFDYIYSSRTETKTIYNEFPFPSRYKSDELMEITWSGASFSGEYSEDEVYGTISGTVSEDGSMITSLNSYWTYEKTSTDYEDREIVVEFESSLSMQNIPLPTLYSNSKEFLLQSFNEDFAESFVEFTYREEATRGGEFYYIHDMITPDLEADGFPSAPHISITFQADN
jgi:hypothetical protein